jgi:hypothetical protein
MRDYEVETWAPDIDDVKEGTMMHSPEGSKSTLWSYQFGSMKCEMKEDDFFVVVELLKTRPRKARILNLRSAQVYEHRVDELLEWHDHELITILPS